MTAKKLTPQKVRAILNKAGVSPPYPSARHQTSGAKVRACGGHSATLGAVHEGAVEIYAPVTNEKQRAMAAARAAGLEVVALSASLVVVRAKEGAA